MGYTLAVLGCGTMGIAVLSAVLDSLESRARDGILNGLSSSSHSHSNGHGKAPNGTGASTPTSSFYAEASESAMPSRFIATVGREESVRRLRRVWRDKGGLGEGVEVWAGTENQRAVKEADVVLVCAKPQMARMILQEEGMQPHLEGKIVISICAGVTIAQMKTWVPESTTVIRAMPNTPSKIREGMTVVTTIPTSQPLQREIVLGLFTSCGKCRFMDEKHFDACTALAGSGPAFVALVLEAMADGGVMMGLPRVEAVELAAQTIAGTGRMVQTGMHPAQLKDSVTTPGGCTIAGLLTLEDGKVRSTIARAIQVAANHATGLGQDVKK